MQKYLLLTIGFLFFSFVVYGQKNDKTPDSNGNAEKQRTNLLLPYGNIGIGTLSPSEKLEVLGSIRASYTVYAQGIEVVGLNATTISIREDLEVGRNILVNGNIGIGLTNPSERLDISGNLRVSNLILADGIETRILLGDEGTFNQTLWVKKRFTVDGLTGLGVNAPVERLEVAGNIKATQNLMADGLIVENGSFGAGVEVNENLLVNGNTGLGVDNPAERLEVNGNLKVTNGILTQTLEGNSFSMQEGTVQNSMTINENALVGGNVGIGTEAPTERLEVAGNIKATGDLSSANLSTKKGDFEGDVSIGQNLTVAGTADFNSAVAMESLNVNGPLESNSIQAESGTFSGQFAVAGPVAMDSTLFVKGALGIGIDKVAGYMLSVNGKIRAGDDIRVYPSAEWADYVFDESYQMPSLLELEQYIRVNHHLPQIPSALKVKEEGIELGAMDARLLQKIEELTLYTIAQEKILAQQKEQFEQMDQEIQALRSELEELKLLIKALAEGK